MNTDKKVIGPAPLSISDHVDDSISSSYLCLSVFICGFNFFLLPCKMDERSIIHQRMVMATASLTRSMPQTTPALPMNYWNN
jgi:hypothetical protein